MQASNFFSLDTDTTIFLLIFEMVSFGLNLLLILKVNTTDKSIWKEM